MKRITVLLAALFALLLCGRAAAEKIITLTFAGDCTLGTEEATRRASDSFDSVARKKGYDYFFANFYDIFSQDDCTVVNCEGVLSDSSNGEVKDKTFRFRGPEEFVNILKAGSVEAVSLANNHSKDYGGDGPCSPPWTPGPSGSPSLTWSGCSPRTSSRGWRCCPCATSC